MFYTSIVLHDIIAAARAWEAACSTAGAALPAHVARILIETGDVVRAAFDGCAACEAEHAAQRDPGPTPRGLDLRLQPGSAPVIAWRTDTHEISLRRTSGISQHIRTAWLIAVECEMPRHKSPRLHAALGAAWCWRNRNLTGGPLWAGGAPSAYATAGDFDASAIIQVAAEIGLTAEALEAFASDEMRAAAAQRPAWAIASDGPHVGYFEELVAYAARHPSPPCLVPYLVPWDPTADRPACGTVSDAEGRAAEAWLTAADLAITHGADVLPISARRL